MSICIKIDTIHIDSCRPKRQGYFSWYVGARRLKGMRAMALDIRMSTEEKVLLRVQPTYTDDAGVEHPAQLHGPATFTMQSGDCTLEAEPGFDDRMWVVSGVAGPSAVSVSGDADLGEGVITITNIANIDVVDPMAENLVLTADTPVKK